ncbi:MAG: TonB-dependent receptor [Myxococcota bacterium]|nr:TonB-dependent receptor [Myxococcota bacterium]
MLFYLIFADSYANPEEDTDSSQEESSALEMVVEDKDEENPLQSPSNMTLIPIDRTFSIGAGVAHAVRRVAGTHVTQLGGIGDFSALSIRGSSLRQVQVYLDGIPLNPDGSSIINLSALPLNAFSRLEVYRGAAPPSFQSAAMGGVLNLVSDPTQSTLRTTASYGSWNTYKASAFYAKSESTQPWSFLGFAEYFQTHSNFLYFDNNATLYNRDDDSFQTRINNDKTQVNTLLNGRYERGNGRLTLLHGLFHRKEGMPGHIHILSPDERLHSWRHYTMLKGEYHDSMWNLQTQLWYNQQLWYNHTQEELHNNGQTQETQLGFNGHDILGGMIEYTSWFRDRILFKTNFSTRWERFQLEDIPLQSFPSPRTRIQLGGSLYANIHLSDSIQLTPLLQLSSLYLRANPSIPYQEEEEYTRNQNALYPTPRVGFLWQPRDDLSFKLNAGQYIRPPDMTELYGSQRGMIGNETLLPEQGIQVDVGAITRKTRQNWHLQLEATHFWNPSQNRIVFVQNSQRTLIAQNVGRAWVQGIEFALSWGHRDIFLSQSNITHTLSRNLNTDPLVANKVLPRTPAIQLHQHTSFFAGKKLQLSHDWSYTSANYWDEANWYGSTPRSLHNAFVSFTLHARAPSLELSCLNITDNIVEWVPRNGPQSEDNTQIQQAVSDFVGFPIAGRTWMLSVRWSPSKQK